MNTVGKPGAEELTGPGGHSTTRLGRQFGDTFADAAFQGRARLRFAPSRA